MKVDFKCHNSHTQAETGTERQKEYIDIIHYTLHGVGQKACLVCFHVVALIVLSCL